MTAWRILPIPASVCDRAALFMVYEQALSFPGWWGRNWDALWDLLADADVTPGPLRIEHAPGFSLPPDELAVYRTLLQDLREERASEVDFAWLRDETEEDLDGGVAPLAGSGARGEVGEEALRVDDAAAEDELD